MSHAPLSLRHALLLSLSLGLPLSGCPLLEGPKQADEGGEGAGAGDGAGDAGEGAGDANADGGPADGAGDGAGDGGAGDGAADDSAGDGATDGGTGDGAGDGDGGAEPIDADGDGYTDDVDCDDADVGVFPGAAERCDGLDNDCDGLTDDQDSFDPATATLYYTDEDGDGRGSPDSSRLACALGEGLAAAPDDCDDADATVHPGAEERCDGRDNDCDGLTDDADPAVTGLLTFYRDADGDAEGSAAEALESCAAPTGYVSAPSDCDDNDPLVGALAAERCGETDKDCDGLIGDLDPDTVTSLQWFADLDADEHGDPATATAACLAPGAGWVAQGDDCDDTAADIAPDAREVCGGIDHDCDGLVDNNDPDADPTTMTDWYADADEDGAGSFAGVRLACTAPLGFVANADDCDDGDSATSPGATETCDGQDNDCDGLFDDADGDVDRTGLALRYPDLDGDGFGDEAAGEALCAAPAGMITVGGDCDDQDPTVSPAALEVCDGLDNDCAPATAEAGTATFWAAAGGPAADWTAAVASGSLTMTEAGALHLCTDTFPLQIDVQSDVELIGHGGAALDAGGLGPALQVGPGASAVRVTGLDLTGGDAAEGGGLRCEGGAAVSLSQLRIFDNAAAEGGGVYNDGCALELTHVDVSDNTADEGGGIAQGAGALLIAGGWVRDNSATLGAALRAATDVRLEGVTVSNNVGDGLFIETGAELTCAADELGGGSVTGHTVGATLDAGASLRSYGCDWGSGAEDNAVDLEDLGESWSEQGWASDTYATADDTGAAPLEWSAAEGLARYVYGTGTTAPVSPECSVQWDIQSVSTEVGCAGCWFAFSLDLGFDPAASEAAGACAGLAFDDTATFGWTPEWAGAPTLLRYDASEGWMPWADAHLIGDRLIFSQGSADTPVWGGYFTSVTTGELVLR